MDDTLTRLYLSMPALLRASSKLLSFSLCLPVPVVKNTCFGRSGVPVMLGRFLTWYKKLFKTNKRGEGDSNPRAVTSTGLAILRPTRLSYLRFAY